MEFDQQEKRPQKKRHTLFWIIFFEIVLILVGLAIVILLGLENQPDSSDVSSTIEYIEETEPDTVVPPPEIDEQLLTVNDWSRPGTKVDSVDYLVIHYLANPKTTAQENRDYFESLKDLQDTSMSANYVVGMDGEIIRCVPEDEIAYASNSYNSISLSIENCHPDKSGKLTDETYASLVRLTAFLADKYDIDREHIIRHYDVTGKDCPKYFVKNPDKWEAFRDDVMEWRQFFIDERKKKKEQESSEIDELTQFMLEQAEEETVLQDGE